MKLRLILIAIIALSPIGLSAFAWRCNSVSFHFKTWGVEYMFQKGSCSSSEQLQMEQVKNDEQ
jgi:hypothetical protein